MKILNMIPGHRTQASTIRASLYRPYALILLLFFSLVTVKSAWISDDAFITLRTVRNVIDGFGPVWNINERVQAYTHPLWMMVLVFASSLTHEYYYTTLAVSLLIGLAAFWVVVRKIAVDWLSASVGGAILILSKTSVDYATSGLENPLTHLILALFAWYYLQRHHHPRAIFWLVLLAALSALNRPDTLLLYLPALLYMTWQARRQWQRVLWQGLLGILPLVMWEIFSLIYYGFPVPNTYYAKLNADIPLPALIQQGLLYYLELVSTDPLTPFIVLAGLLLPWSLRNWRLVAFSLGILLYMLYVLRIGGDFMSGRMVSAPLFAAVIVLARWPLTPLPTYQTAALALAILLLGFANPPRSPWMSNATYEVSEINNKGIADERGYYYQRYGLLQSNRFNRLRVMGTITGTEEPATSLQRYIGYSGFVSSPYTHIVDQLALTDPLLARLPALRKTDWRIGHLTRHVPAGYLTLIKTGENHLHDPQLQEYYRRLQLVISGPLFSLERWAEIWRFNTGQNESLIDRFYYAHPQMPTLPWEHFARGGTEQLVHPVKSNVKSAEGSGNDAEEPVVSDAIEFADQGITIELGALRHDRLIDLDLNNEWFDVVYLNQQQPQGKQQVGEQTVAYMPLNLAGNLYTVIQVPTAIADAGYTHIRLMPRLPGTYTLSRVALASSATQPLISDAKPLLVDLLRLFYFIFYRSDRDVRDEQLNSLRLAIAEASPAEWEQVPVEYKNSLLQLPDPTMQMIVTTHFTNTAVINNGER